MGAREEPTVETQQCKLRADAKTLKPNRHETEIKTNSKKPESEHKGRRGGFTCDLTKINKALPALTLDKSK